MFVSVCTMASAWLTSTAAVSISISISAPDNTVEHGFGHISRANPSTDHSRALRSSVHWNRRSSRPRQTWLCTVESDVTPLNVGLARCCYVIMYWLLQTDSANTVHWVVLQQQCDNATLIIVIAPILWGHSGPLCHTLSLLLLWTWACGRRATRH